MALVPKLLVPGFAWNANRKRLCRVMYQQALGSQEPQMPGIPGRAWNQNAQKK